ncbi:MAG: ELM1/GtrOC1 family putative glycosyltransferase [Rhodovibrionaceae bacterium]|nr:ELM1/GtrOC1 family putative glycosyltransferase [Rhodovibrionaceae bacterium]
MAGTDPNDSTQAAFRENPDVVVLPPREGVEPSEKPPVRIFLGTEDDQWRAERVFFYSIEEVRDPSRCYEIHLMKNISGFDRSKWRTGFTNYRFAIPDFAGREGRAIYNDVDQIYLADPARLFDLDLNGHGYLSVSAEDTSVMLLDCARMAEWWSREAASHAPKSKLIAEPARTQGLWGELDGGWNARDMEYFDGHSMLLHYTALHQQPWHPFPDVYSYHDHPLGEVWYRLERKADAEGYQIFDFDRPSPRFAQALRDAEPAAAPEPQASVRDFLASLQVRELCVLRLPRGDTGSQRMGALGDLQTTDLPVDRLDGQENACEAVAAFGVLEALPAEDVPWLLDAMFRQAKRGVYLSVRCGDPPGRESNIDVRRARRPLKWWRQQVAAAAARHPEVAWHMDALTPEGELHELRSEGLGGAPPCVWVLEGRRKGDNAQLHRLAEAMDWPFELKRLKFNKLHLLPNFLLGPSLANLRPEAREALQAPWPDVIVAAGKRSSGAARWIKQQSGGRTRIVHLGRPWTRLDAFDLLVTTPQYRLPARPNVLHNSLPLTPVSEERLAKARAETKESFDDLPRPLIAVLVGGDSWSYALDPATARKLGESASDMAREAGGSLLVTTSPRTRPESADALFEAIDVPHHAHRFEPDREANPYLTYLAMADRIVVTGDSASMLSDAVATGCPVRVFPLPLRLHARLLASPGRIAEHLAGRRKTYRGTPRQQGPLARFYDSIVDRGLLTPARDLEVLQRTLAQRGLIQPRSEGPRAHMTVPLHDLERAAERVRRVFSEGRRLSKIG